MTNLNKGIIPLSVSLNGTLDACAPKCDIEALKKYII